MRVHDAAGLVAIARLHQPRNPVAIMLLIGAPDRTERDAITTGEWIGTLLGRRIAVAELVRVDRETNDPTCRRAAGKTRRHVLHRLGFGIGSTPEGLELAAIDGLATVVRRRRVFRRLPVGIAGIGAGSRLALLAGSIVSGVEIVALTIDSGDLLDRDDGPLDERIHASSTLSRRLRSS